MTFPRALPGLRWVFSGLMGTSRATGRPPLAITISSPCCTRSISFEKWVFASYVALDQRYISRTDFDKCYQKADEIACMLSGLITYLSKPSGRTG